MNPPPTASLFKDSRGAILADAHYTETGHEIKETGQSIEKRSGMFEITKRYKCNVCNFESFAGEITRTP
jgi:hypothetical protein